jgi:xanthine dehydrogenase small subunit
MVDCHGSQCGFCTPGFVMSLYGLWLTNDNPTRAEIETALQGNLCRCTGYEPIVKAAEIAALTKPSPAFDAIIAARREVVEKLVKLNDGRSVQIVHHGDETIIPGSVGDLAEALAAHPHATVVAGSTDVGLWVTKQMRKINPVIFIGNLAGLQSIKVEDKGVTIGAGVTYSQALATLEKTHPALGNIIPRIGGGQVRNMGTIGGNIANGSPIGDTPPPLIALGAEVTLRSREGARTLRLEDFFIEYGKQDRQKHEFVESVFVPALPENARYAVYKITKRRDEDITAVLAAFYLVTDEDNRVVEFRAAYGGMAGVPKRAANLEAALLGQFWTEASVFKASGALARDFSPLTDWRASADYRMLTAKNLVLRFLLETEGEQAELVRYAGGLT